MKKIFSLFLIFILLITQSGPAVILAEAANNQNSIDIKVDENSTKERTILNISSQNEALESIELLLPKKSKFSREISEALTTQQIKIKYDANAHKAILSWDANLKSPQVKIALTDVTEEKNIVSVRGSFAGSLTAYSDYSFSVAQEEPKTESSEEPESEKVTTDQQSNTNTNKNEVQKDEQIQDIPKGEVLQENETLKKDIAKKIESKSMKATAIHSAGNLNVDINLSPQMDTVLAGNDAAYNLILKFTGSRSEFTNSKLLVDLPIKDYTEFKQDLNELKINGVVPTFDDTKNQLIYELGTVKPGRSYEVLIKVNTKNGLSPHAAQLTAQASFESDQHPSVTDDAAVTIDANSTVTISKQFIKTTTAPNQLVKPGSKTLWEIKVEIPKKDKGQMYLKEGSEIVVTDTIPAGMTYVVDNSVGPAPTTRVGQTLTWRFPAPSQAEQETGGRLFTKTIQVYLQANANVAVGTKLTNTAKVDVTFLDNKVKSATNSATVEVVDPKAGTGDITGNHYVPSHRGPANGNGGIATNELKDPNPTVYDDALLGFGTGIVNFQEGQYHDFREYNFYYFIDPNLILKELKTPNWSYRPNNSYPAGIKLERNPEYTIFGMVNGVERVLVANPKNATTYTRQQLGLSEADRVTRIRYGFTYAPAGMHGLGTNFFFNVKPGFTGQVENSINAITVDHQGNRVNRNLSDVDISRPTHATIAPRPVTPPPTARVAVKLQNENGSNVVHGDNRMEVNLYNTTSSAKDINKPISSVVLLPLGITLKANANVNYVDSQGRHSRTDSSAAGGSYEVLDNNYNGSGRQLIKVSWDDTRLKIGQNVTAALDVEISDNAPNTLQFDVYGFTGEPQLLSPGTSGTNITDTILQVDSEDLNNNGNTTEPRVKSGNIYSLRGQYDIETEKLVKGELDSAFSQFGHTSPGGAIDYQVKMTNTTGKNVSNMTLIDVLPSVGDLGITDNVDRGSMFTPKMTGAISVPSDWADKVNIYYSIAKKPMRDDLTKNTKYPDTTAQLSNPSGAEEPNWQLANAVTDWSKIHSFKIELKPGVEWAKGDDITIAFSMNAPSESEVDRNVLDRKIPASERAAWNSFAVATDHGQPVEPLRVGVYMDYDIVDPTVDKTINDKKETLELANLNEKFTWKVDYDFGNYTGKWESVVLSDQLNNLLEIVDVKVVNHKNEDVAANGTLNIGQNNLIEFTLNKREDSFAYLNGQTYTLVIESKIKSSATEAELEPFIQSNGIPNTGTLTIDNEPTESNEVKVKPPVFGKIEILKVDKDTSAVLQGAEFELRKCAQANSSIADCEIVTNGTTDAAGKLRFEEIPIGMYKLVETKAPEGYRLLTKPLDVEITQAERDIKLTVENTKSDWQIPNTGGIGSVGFYAVGALIMLGALTILFRRKKVNES